MRIFKKNDCAERPCPDKKRKHYRCRYCGKNTCRQTVLVVHNTLRRRKVWQCTDCSVSMYDRHQSLRNRRSKKDWTRPLPDQYPGIARETIGSFVKSEEQEREAPINSGSLNSSLESLGMDRELFAEQRSNRTFLRKVE